MDTPDQRRVEQADERRRPYDRPVIAWEEEFSPYAFSGCGKMAAQGGACMIVKLS